MNIAMYCSKLKKYHKILIILKLIPYKKELMIK